MSNTAVESFMRSQTRRWLLLLSLLPSLAVARTFTLSPTASVVGNLQVLVANYEDTFAELGERESLGYLELVHANPDVDPWLPGDGTQVVLPTRYVLPSAPRQGIVINLAEFRLYYFKGDQVETYPVGVGTSQNPSPLTKTQVTMRLESPTWYPPQSVRDEYAANGDPLPAKIPAGPENPLGPYALQLAEQGYLIHGTNKQFGIGMQVSHGCIRMYNEDISRLVWEVGKGTAVSIVDEPVKLGVQGQELWIEVHSENQKLTPERTDRLWSDAERELEQIRQRHPDVEIQRALLEAAIEQADGIPHRIGEVLDDRYAGESGGKTGKGREG
ncbi:L,D-transpeptidase family protein [Marinobacteraceae bacterium S3BR75-40.1]